MTWVDENLLGILDLAVRLELITLKVQVRIVPQNLLRGVYLSYDVQAPMVLARCDGFNDLSVVNASLETFCSVMYFLSTPVMGQS